MVLKGHYLGVFIFKRIPLQEFVVLVKKENRLKEVIHGYDFPRDLWLLKISTGLKGHLCRNL
jgi:hypothetical protein